MAGTRGFQTQAAVAAEVTYNLELATTTKLRYISDTMNKQWEPIENEMLAGIGSMSTSDQGLASVGGDLLTEWDYRLADTMFTKFFGDLTTGAFTLTDIIDGLGYTLALGKVVEEHVFTGCKASQLVLSGAPGQAMRCAWSLLPNDRVLGSTLNTQAVLDAIAEPAAARVLFHHLAFWIGDTADILVIGDAIKVNSWQLTINRNLSQFHANSQTPEQALEDGFQMVELQFTTPLYEDNFFITAHAAHTPLQMKATWTRSTTTKIIRAPNMYVVSAPVPIAGPGLVPRTVTLRLYNDLANINASADMTFVEPLKLFET